MDNARPDAAEMSATETIDLRSENPATTAFSLVLRVAVSAVFLLSGILKVTAPGQFLLDVQAFELTPYWASYALAAGLPWLEIVGGLAVFTGCGRRGGLIVLGGLTLVFIVALAAVWARGMAIDCGCFGTWLAFPSYPLHIGFNVLLLIGICALGWVESRRRS